VGYTLDHFFGDSEYSGKEAFVDGTTGLIGGGLVNPVIKVGSRVNKVIKYGGDDAVKAITKGEMIMTAGYVTAPMASAPVRKELIGGAVAGLVYDVASRMSPGSRSERNASDVGPGGTSLGRGRKTMQKMVKPVYRKGRDPCPPGYSLRTRNGRRMCVMD